MSQNPNVEVFTNKKKLKGPIKFKIELNSEQKDAKQGENNVSSTQ